MYCTCRSPSISCPPPFTLPQKAFSPVSASRSQQLHQTLLLCHRFPRLPARLQVHSLSCSPSPELCVPTLPPARLLRLLPPSVHCGAILLEDIIKKKKAIKTCKSQLCIMRVTRHKTRLSNLCGRFSRLTFAFCLVPDWQ